MADPDDPRILHTGEGKVLVGLTSQDIADLVKWPLPLELRNRLLKAYALLGVVEARNPKPH